MHGLLYRCIGFTNREKDMRFSRLRKERLLPILINRTVIFFFVMSILTMLLYVTGTVQGFIDSTQLTLLRLYSIFGVFLSTSSAFGVFLDILRFARLRRTRYLFRAGGYVFMVFFGIATVLAALFIITLAEGNRVM